MADPTSVVGRRIGAYAIDLLLIGIISFALIYPIFMSASKTAPSGTVQCAESDFGSTDSNIQDTGNEIDSSFCFDLGDEVRYIPDEDTGAFTAKVYGLGFGIQVLNLVVLQALTGASVGKLLVGLRVVRADGQKAGFGWMALRWILLLVDSFCCFLPGAILVFTTKGHRRLGDMAASTYVVRAGSMGTPLQIPGVTTGYGTPGYGAGPYGQAGYGQPQYGQQAPGAWPAGPAAGGSTWAPSGDVAAPTPPAAPAAEGPTWDSARNAYIQYDRDQNAWVQWSDTAQSWHPIDQ
ncbi:hypothetical protein BH10ACT1_BH10ACT1_00390 [soil metagenome]